MYLNVTLAVTLSNIIVGGISGLVAVVVSLLFYVQSKHLRSCRDGQLT